MRAAFHNARIGIRVREVYDALRRDPVSASFVLGFTTCVIFARCATGSRRRYPEGCVRMTSSLWSCSLRAAATYSRRPVFLDLGISDQLTGVRTRSPYPAFAHNVRVFLVDHGYCRAYALMALAERYVHGNKWQLEPRELYFFGERW